AENEYLVVWSAFDQVALKSKPSALPTYVDDLEIFGQRVRADGIPIGADDFRISAMGPDGEPGFHAWRPALCWNRDANEYLVAWFGLDGNTTPDVAGAFLFGQRLDRTALAIGADDFPII